MSSRFEPNHYPLDAGVRLLEASAGTGKTFALAHLVLRLVTERKLNLKELLVVTFTEAAAAELRERIGRRLNDALQALLKHQTNNSDSQTDSPPTDAVMEEWITLHGQDPNTRRTIASNLLEALEGLERADITTIHGFCRRNLRRQALQNGTAMEVCLENDSQHLCQEVAYDYWEQQVLALPPDHVSGLLDAGLSADQLSHALSRLDSDCAVRIAGTEGSDDLERPLIDCFAQWLQSSWTVFEAEWNASGRTLETALRDCSTDWRSQGQTDTKPYSPKPKKIAPTNSAAGFPAKMTRIDHASVTETCEVRVSLATTSIPDVSAKQLAAAANPIQTFHNQSCKKPLQLCGMDQLRRFGDMRSPTDSRPWPPAVLNRASSAFPACSMPWIPKRPIPNLNTGWSQFNGAIASLSSTNFKTPIHCSGACSRPALRRQTICC